MCVLPGGGAWAQTALQASGMQGVSVQMEQMHTMDDRR